MKSPYFLSLCNYPAKQPQDVIARSPMSSYRFSISVASLCWRSSALQNRASPLNPAVRAQTSLASGAAWSPETGGDLSWGWSWEGGCSLEDASRWQASVGHPGRHPQTFKVAEVKTRGDGSHGERCHRAGREGQGKTKQGGFSDVAWSSPAEFSGFPVSFSTWRKSTAKGPERTTRCRPCSPTTTAPTTPTAARCCTSWSGCRPSPGCSWPIKVRPSQNCREKTWMTS